MTRPTLKAIDGGQSVVEQARKAKAEAKDYANRLARLALDAGYDFACQCVESADAASDEWPPALQDGIKRLGEHVRRETQRMEVALRNGGKIR